MPGLSLGCSARCSQDEDDGFHFLCVICGQIIDSEESRVHFDIQFEKLDSQPDLYNPCLECGQRVSNPDDENYRATMTDHIRVLKKYKAGKERHVKNLEETKEWPADTKSLVGALWGGECPICKVDMRVNQGDYFECPSCRMQIQAVSDGPNILRLKGMGQFRLNRDKMYLLAVDELHGFGAWKIKRDNRV